MEWRSQQNSGCGIKWLIDVSKGPFSVPLGRGQYTIGLQKILLTNIAEKEKWSHVCVHPKINSATYISDAHPVSSVMSILTENEGAKCDLYTHNDYFDIDFTQTDQLTVNFVNNSGDIVLDVKGHMMFEIYKK